MRIDGNLRTNDRNYKLLSVSLFTKNGMLQQFNSLPTPSESFVGDIVQYIGNSTQSLTKGAIYVCEYISGNYLWTLLSIGGGITLTDVWNSLSTVKTSSSEEIHISHIPAFDNYLPLSAGIDKKLTGSLYFGSSGNYLINTDGKAWLSTVVFIDGITAYSREVLPAGSILDRIPIDTTTLSTQNGLLTVIGGGGGGTSVSWGTEVTNENVILTVNSTSKTLSLSTHTHTGVYHPLINTDNKLSVNLINGLSTVATSGSYNDLSNKPSIPNTTDDLTEGSTNLYFTNQRAINACSSIFLKLDGTSIMAGNLNMGNYQLFNASSILSNGGITAYSSNVQPSGSILDNIPIGTGLSIVDGILTAIGSGGTVTSITMNQQSYTPTSGVINLGTVITAHQTLPKYDSNVMTSSTNIPLVKTSTWDNKYDKPANGIPKTDLSNAVQASLGLADTAVQDTDYKHITVTNSSVSDGTNTFNKYTHPTGGANTTISAANGKVLSAITVNNLGHVTSVSSKTLAFADIPNMYIGTTAVQSTSQNQALTGITTGSFSLQVSASSFKTNGSGDVFSDGYLTLSGDNEQPVPVIQFHYGGSQSYTVRLAEEISGLLCVRGNLRMLNNNSNGIISFGSSTHYIDANGNSVLSSVLSYGAITAYSSDNQPAGSILDNIPIDTSTLQVVNGTLKVIAGSGVGSVTSVGLTVPTGFSITGSPITSSGTLAISFASGYSLPTTAKQTEWDSKSNVSWGTAGTDYIPLSVNNVSKNLLTSHQSLAGYATENWVNNKGYLTGITSSQVTTALGYTPYNSTNPSGFISGITKAMVEAVLTGSISSHSHAYLPLSGGVITGTIQMNGGEDISPLERNFTYTSSNGWSRDIATFKVDGNSKFNIGAYGMYTVGAEDNGIEYAYIGCKSWNGLNLRISPTSLKWGSNDIYHSGNLTSSTLMGSSAKGGTNTPVYWNGSAWTNCTAYASASVNYATSTGYANKVLGSYTGNGGQQNPNYFGMTKVGFLMMNTTVNSNSQYKDWIIMDCYGGNDVGGGVAFGVNRQSLGAYIMRSNSDRESWTESAELYGTHNCNNTTTTWNASSLTLNGAISGATNITANGSVYSNRYGASGYVGGAAFVFNKGDDYFGIGPSATNINITSLGTVSNTTGTWKSEQITIWTDGKVGIGTTSPSYKLDVNGTLGIANATTIKYNTPTLWITNTVNNTYSIIRFGTAANKNAAYIFLNGSERTEDGGANTFTIRNNVGNLRLDNHTIITKSLTIDSNTIGGNDHLIFNRASYNYIRANVSGGSINFISNGKALAAANVDLSIVDSKVGIGTTTPSQVLDVVSNGYHFLWRSGSIETLTNPLWLNYYSGSSVIIGGISSTTYKLHVNGSAYATSLTLAGAISGATTGSFSGNVSVGGTLSVTNAVTINTGINLTEGKYLQFRLNDNKYYTTLRYDTVGNEALILGIKNSVTSFIVKSGDSGTTAITTTGFTTSGFVPSIQVKGLSLYVNSLIANGVTPAYNFYVNGTTNITGHVNLESTLHASGIIYASVDTATTISVRAGNSNGTISLLTATDRGIYDNTNDTWLIGTTGTNTYLIDGNVGIGTRNPLLKLHVNGTILANSGITSYYSGTLPSGSILDNIPIDGTLTKTNGMLSVVGGGGGGGSWSGGTVTSSIIPSTTNQLNLGNGSNRWSAVFANQVSIGTGWFQEDNYDNMWAYPSDSFHVCGDIYAGDEDDQHEMYASYFRKYSDERKKHIISEKYLSLSEINSMRSVLFNFYGKQNVRYGTIAQDVLQVLPEVVATDKNGYYSLDYGNLAVGLSLSLGKIALTHEERIEELEDRILELQAEIALLKS